MARCGPPGRSGTDARSRPLLTAMRWAASYCGAMSSKERFVNVDMPAGGWGSAQTTGSLLLHEHVLLKGSRVLLHQNKPDGFACVSCSWAKPAQPHFIEACENGIKATAWEITSKRTPPEFFEQHPLGELRGWSDLRSRTRGASPRRCAGTPRGQVCARRGRRPLPTSAVGSRAGARIGDLLRLGPCIARDRLPLPAVRPPVRLQQLARQLEHVPREHVGGPCRKPSACRSVRWSSRTSSTPTAYFSSGRMSEPTARGCCITYRMRDAAACPSSPSTPCVNAAWSVSQPALAEGNATG